jgi:hypothetical protein
VSAKTNNAIRAREQAKIRPSPIAVPKKAKKTKVEPVPEPIEIASDYAESAE